MPRYVGWTGCLLISLFAAAAPVRAQPATALRLGIGLEQAALRNPSESPYRYAGWGPALFAGVERHTRSTVLTTSLHMSASSLHSSISGARVNDHLASIDVRYLRALSSGAQSPTWMVGGQLAGIINAAEHQYASSWNGYSDYFAFLTASLAAVARTNRSYKTMSFTNEIAIPLASWVDFPYSNAKVDDGALQLRFASLNALQGVDEALTLRTKAPGKLGIDWRYRFTFLRYASTDVRRFVRQSVSAVVNVPLGRSR